MVEIDIGGIELSNLEYVTIYFLVAELVIFMAMKQMVTGIQFWIFFTITSLIALVGSYFFAQFQVNKG